LVGGTIYKLAYHVVVTGKTRPRDQTGPSRGRDGNRGRRWGLTRTVTGRFRRQGGIDVLRKKTSLTELYRLGFGGDLGAGVKENRRSGR